MFEVELFEVINVVSIIHWRSVTVAIDVLRRNVFGIAIFYDRSVAVSFVLRDWNVILHLKTIDLVMSIWCVGFVVVVLHGGVAIVDVRFRRRVAVVVLDFILVGLLLLVRVVKIRTTGLLLLVRIMAVWVSRFVVVITMLLRHVMLILMHFLVIVIRVEI